MNLLNDLTKEELAEMYNKLNCWEWDGRLGPKPKDWDSLPNYKRNYSVLSKRVYIEPIMMRIKNLIGVKETFRWYHLNELNITKLEFELWWIKRSIRKFFTGDVI